MKFEYVSCKKIKINLSKTQKETVNFWLRKCQILYNVALEEKIAYYRATNKYLNVYDQKKELTLIKQDDPTWKDVPNKSLQEIIFRVDKAFKAFFNRKFKGFPKFKSNLNTIEFVKKDVRIKNDELYIPKIKTSIKLTEKVPTNYTSVKLSRNYNNYYLVFTLKDTKEIKKENKDILGIDLGLKDLYTDSNGRKGKRFSQKLIKKYHKRIENLNKSLSTKKKGSIKFNKVKKQLNKTYKRLNNSKNDYLHKSANELLRCSEQFIALGDINVQSIVKRYSGDYTKKGLIKSFYTNSLSIFKNIITYKAIKYNKIIILVDESNTSKKCSCCGNIKYDLKLSNRIYTCDKCNNSIDRDENSGINMKLLGSSTLYKYLELFQDLPRVLK